MVLDWKSVLSDDTSSQLPLHFDPVPLDAARADAVRAVRSARPVRSTWRVSQLVAEARSLVEQALGTVWVEGEISNFRPSSAGHLYFTLKDEAAQLSVVLFRRQALLLRFRAEDGLAVRVRGALGVYEQRGQLQLVAETMEPVGVGSLQLAFEQLRERLRAEGLFDAERKRALPMFPRVVAIVTSPTGAVVRDFLQIARRRYAGLEVLVVPVAVQGESAAGEIEAALGRLADPSLPVVVDVVVLARGGGSLEDLAAFNSERVARAIVASPVPVISAIGHETDFTIADFVADLRAPTPSAAAELVTAALSGVTERVAEVSRRLERAARFQLLQARQHLAAVRESRMEQRVTGLVRRRQQRLDEQIAAQETAMAERLRARRGRLEGVAARLQRHDPQRELGNARARLAGLQERLKAAALRECQAAGQRHEFAGHALERAMGGWLAARRDGHERARVQLTALSPLAVLERGYALVETADGTIVRDAARLRAGEVVQTRVGVGSFRSRVESADGDGGPLKPKDGLGGAPSVG